MMTAAHRQAVAIGERCEVVRMSGVHHKTDRTGMLFCGSKDPQTRDRFHSLQSVLSKIDVVFEDFAATNAFEIINRGAQADCAGDAGCSGFETLWRFFECAF